MRFSHLENHYFQNKTTMYFFKFGFLFGRFFASILWSGFAFGNGDFLISILSIPIFRIGKHIMFDPFEKSGIWIFGIKILNF